ncbi:MAG TPA: glycine oxidase ThiO [Pirellulales bacterium]|jgi:glycine oxidase|nr:glycine oxidase ThiO [Pirellulales bacterium]
MHDCLIVGGGVIGLSLAYELARRGMKVRVADRQLPGREASWAAAGIMPPPPSRPDLTPLERLTALSMRLHADWAGRLLEETEIDYGYQRCGGFYLADCDAAVGELEGQAAVWRQDGIAVETLSPAAVARLEPALADAAENGLLRSALLVPDEMQLRNPRYLQALTTACAARGVEITAGAEVEEFECHGGRMRSVRTRHGQLVADRFCITSGCWSGLLLARLGIPVAIKPIRGQIVLLSMPEMVLKRIVYVGPHYYVPRDDGRILVGSTLEDAGFNRQTTSAVIRELLDFAIAWVPALREANFERCWAGLRPASGDGIPYLGRLPGLDNAYVAAGHYRSGLILSPATAVVMAQLIQGQEPAVDLHPFRAERELVNGS